VVNVGETRFLRGASIAADRVLTGEFRHANVAAASVD